MYSENRLMHYGIKGMHWGVRRFQPYSSTGPHKSGISGKEVGKAAKKSGKTAKTVSKYAFVKNYFPNTITFLIK